MPWCMRLIPIPMGLAAQQSAEDRAKTPRDCAMLFQKLPVPTLPKVFSSLTTPNPRSRKFGILRQFFSCSNEFVVKRGMRHEPLKLVGRARKLQWRPSTSDTRPLTSNLLHRCISIQQTPASSTPTLEDPASHDLDAPTNSQSSATPDARFEVLGSSSSLLSVALSASQNLYTRRGTLVGVSGSPENAVSSLSPLSPLVRAPTGMPFLYQKISSTTSLNLLVSTKSPHTSFSVLHLDGRVDWTVAQRNGLLAWSGHTLSVKPTVNAKMSLAHWGNTIVTGRGLVALTAPGNTYQVTLSSDEHYVAHPSNVLAYTINSYPPQPYRFMSTSLRFQLPNLSTYLPNTRFFREMRNTSAYIFIANTMHTLRTWTRRTIWGDRLFLRFQGPTTILLQSRGSRIRDVLTSRDANEIANAPAGIVQQSPTLSMGNHISAQSSQADKATISGQHVTSTKMSYASVGKTGNVSFSKE